MHITQCNNLPMTCLKKESRKIYIIYHPSPLMWSTSAHTSPERLRSMRTKDGMLARRASRLLCPICLCGMCSPVSSLYSDCRCDNDTPPLLDCRMPRSIFFATSASAIWRKKHTKTNPKRNFLNTSVLKSFTLIMTQTHTNVHTGWVYTVGQWRTG